MIKNNNKLNTTFCHFSNILDMPCHLSWWEGELLTDLEKVYFQ